MGRRRIAGLIAAAGLVAAVVWLIRGSSSRREEPGTAPVVDERPGAPPGRAPDPKRASEEDGPRATGLTGRTVTLGGKEPVPLADVTITPSSFREDRWPWHPR